MKEHDRTKKERYVLSLREQGKTQQEIASVLSVSRQRVQQIEKSIGLPPRSLTRRAVLRTIRCLHCNKEISVYSKTQIYCSRACYTAQKVGRVSEEERLEIRRKRMIANRARAKRYYHTVFKKNDNWRELVKEKNRRYLGNKKKG